MKFVLLDGFLNKAKYERAYAEIESAGGEEICLVVSSLDGLDSNSTADFIELVKAADLDRQLVVKIYAAGVGAALVATSLGHRREMHCSATLCFFDGTFTVEAVALGPGGTLPNSIMASINRLHALNSAALARVGITDKKHVEKFQNSGKLVLTAEECLQLGVVQSLF